MLETGDMQLVKLYMLPVFYYDPNFFLRKTVTLESLEVFGRRLGDECLPRSPRAPP